jgi:hypothetical protein
MSADAAPSKPFGSMPTCVGQPPCPRAAHRVAQRLVAGIFSMEEVHRRILSYRIACRRARDVGTSHNPQPGQKERNATTPWSSSGASGCATRTSSRLVGAHQSCPLTV